MIQKEPPASNSKEYRKGTKRRHCVIEDVDQLSMESIKPSLKRNAEQRLQDFYEKLDLNIWFLIVIGRDEGWMGRSQWGKEIEEFNHNRPFPEYIPVR